VCRMLMSFPHRPNKKSNPWWVQFKSGKPWSPIYVLKKYLSVFHIGGGSVLSLRWRLR
jgi:hypothetical protein